MQIHHIGYLVKNIERTRRGFERLRFTAERSVIYDCHRDVDILLMENGGYTVELVTPRSERSVVAGLMKKFKNMPYHICYVSEELEADIEMLTGEGRR